MAKTRIKELPGAQIDQNITLADAEELDAKINSSQFPTGNLVEAIESYGGTEVGIQSITTPISSGSSVINKIPFTSSDDSIEVARTVAGAIDLKVAGSSGLPEIPVITTSMENPIPGVEYTVANPGGLEVGQLVMNDQGFLFQVHQIYSLDVVLRSVSSPIAKVGEFVSGMNFSSRAYLSENSVYKGYVTSNGRELCAGDYIISYGQNCVGLIEGEMTDQNFWKVRIISNAGAGTCRYNGQFPSSAVPGQSTYFGDYGITPYGGVISPGSLIYDNNGSSFLVTDISGGYIAGVYVTKANQSGPGITAGLDGTIATNSGDSTEHVDNRNEVRIAPADEFLSIDHGITIQETATQAVWGQVEKLFSTGVPDFQTHRLKVTSDITFNLPTPYSGFLYAGLIIDTDGPRQIRRKQYVMNNSTTLFIPASDLATDLPGLTVRNLSINVSSNSYDTIPPTNLVGASVSSVTYVLQDISTAGLLFGGEFKVENDHLLINDKNGSTVIDFEGGGGGGGLQTEFLTPTNYDQLDSTTAQDNTLYFKKKYGTGFDLAIGEYFEPLIVEGTAFESFSFLNDGDENIIEFRDVATYNSYNLRVYKEGGIMKVNFYVGQLSMDRNLYADGWDEQEVSPANNIFRNNTYEVTSRTGTVPFAKDAWAFLITTYK